MRFACGKTGGILEGEKRFTNTFLPQTPFEKQITYYQKYFLLGRVFFAPKYTELLMLSKSDERINSITFFIFE